MSKFQSSAVTRAWARPHALRGAPTRWLLSFALCACGHVAPKSSATPKPAAAAPDAPPVTQAPSQPATSAAAPVAKPTEPGPAPDATHPDAPRVAANDYLPALMGQHFMIATLARDAVIDGNVEPVRSALRALVEYKYPPELPQSWGPSLVQLQAAAGATAGAATLEDAANGVAAMARVCGDCHLETSGKAKLGHAPREAANPKPDSLDERMYRHIWALDRMWVGLTGPSDDAWNAGAAVLANAPRKLHTTAGVSKELIGLLQVVSELGDRARHAKSSQDRATVYGRMLATCARCHAFRAEAAL